MSDDVRFERLLADVLADSAPTGAPERLVPDILAAARRARRWPRWLTLGLERPMRRRQEVLVGSPALRVAYLLVIASLAGLLATAGLVAGGIVHLPTQRVVTLPQATPTATLEDCLTDHVRLLPGSSAPPATQDDGHVTLVSPDAAFGVFKDHTGRLWVAGGGRTEPFNFGLVGVDPGFLNLGDQPVDVSPDRSRVLVRSLQLSVSGRDPNCGDLYEFAVDGSGRRRLTSLDAGSFVAGAAYAPDGNSIAYGVYARDRGELVVSRPSGEPVSFACEFGFGGDPPARIVWSPDGSRVATSCGGTVTVFDPSRRLAPVTGVSNEELVAFGWRDPATLLIASGRQGLNPGGLLIRTLDTVSGAAELITPVDDANITWVSSSPSGFSGDGAYLYAPGGTTRPGPDFAEDGYRISTGDGAATLTLVQGQEFLHWSDGGSAILYLDDVPAGGGLARDLVRLEASTGQTKVLGTWTTGCTCNGLWRTP